MSERGRIFMVKKVLACLLLVVLWCSCAFGATELWNTHHSVASITDGKADYSDARFSVLYFSVIHTDTPVTKETAHLTGSITLSGGNYSFWNGKEIQKVSGTQQTFKLGMETWLASGDEVAYQLFDDAGGELKMGVESDNGLNGVTMSWNFPDDPSINGSFTMPNYLTTQEQLNSGVLYFEFIRSGDVVTGIDWRVVKASDTATPVAQDFRRRFQSFEIWNYDESKILNDRPRIYIEAGETPEGTYEFSTPIKESDIARIRTRLRAYDESAEKNYSWYYYMPSEPDMYLWHRHASDASLINGKSDYSGAKFSNVFFSHESRSPLIMTEAKHFTDTGRVTIPGGGYTLVDTDTGATLSTVTGNATMKLRFDSEGAIGDEYLEYWPIDDSGNLAAFAGTETALNGKTISWTFPAELAELNGSGVIPNYKTTAQQLETGVPYVEIVSEDGYITALNYKIVTASDTSTAITPNHRTDFRFYFDRATGKDVWANTYRPGWIRNTSSGTLTLDIPQPLSIVKRVRVRLRSYEDSADNPAVYQWNFYPAEAPSSLAITTATLPSGTVNYSYSANLEANISGATWSISSGSLPSGLTLNQSTGQITGVPTTSGDYTFTVKAEKDSQSAEKQLSITIGTTPTITITTTSLPSGTVGASYSAQLAASTAGATWSVSSGTLPAGLSLNASTGAITGTPTAANTYTFTVKAAIGSASAEKSFTVTINPVTTLTITTESLSSGVRGQSYSATLEANISGATWSVISGTLPEGLTLSTSGRISGTPTEGGTYSFTVRAVSGSQSAEKELSIRIMSIGASSSSSGCESGLSVSALFLLALILKKR